MMNPDQEYSDKEGEETFIDPNDLNIINNDYDWEPNDDDIINYASQLGFDIENDPQEFLEIAYNYLKKPLPKGWKRAFQKENGELLYIDMSTHEIHLSTQLEEMAKEEYLMNKKEYEQRERAKEEAKKKVTVVPRTKIPPLGAKKPKENKNQIKEKEFMEKLAKDKQKEDQIKQNEEMKVIKSQLERKKSDNGDNGDNADEGVPLNLHFPNAENDQKNSPIAKEINRFKFGELDNGHRRKHYYQPEVYEDLNAQMNHKRKDSNDQSSPEKEKENESSYVSVSPNAYATPDRVSKKQEENKSKILPQNSSSSLIVPEANQNQQNSIEPKLGNQYEKEKYLEKKQDQLKQFKQKLQIDYDRLQKNLDQTCNEKYEKAFLEAKRKMKDKASNKAETSALNKHYESIFLDAIEDYKQSMKNFENNKNANEKDSIDKWERELSDMKRKKNDLANTIKIQKENNKIQRTRRLSNMKEQIQKEKLSKEERIKIQKDSLFQKSIANISTIELRYDNQLRQQKSNFNASQSMSFGKFMKTPAVFDQKQYEAILHEHEQLLEQSFQIKKMEIDKEFQINREKDLEEQRQMSLNETQDKICLVNKEINELEKEFYYELNSIRSKSKMTKDRDAKITRDQLNGLSNSFDQLKTSHSSFMDMAIKEIVTAIQEVIRLSQGSNIIHSSESKCEETLMLKIGEADVLYQKSKTLYLLTEKDFKQKLILLMYFYDIGNYLSKRLIERPLNQLPRGISIEDDEVSKEVSEGLIKALFDFGRGKMSAYHNKYIASYSTSLFPFIGIDNVGPSNDLTTQISFTQLMFQDRSVVVNQFKSEFASSRSLDNRETPKEEELYRHQQQEQQHQQQYSNDKRAFSSESIRVYPIHSNREIPERYNNIALSQHDIIKECEESQQQNQAPQLNSKDSRLLIETPNLSKSINLVQSSNNFNQQHQSFVQLKQQQQLQQPLSSNDKSLFLNSDFNYANYEPSFMPTIPEDIKAKLSDEDFLIYSKINDFLQVEEMTLLKQETEIGNKRAVFDQLTQFNDKGFLLQISNNIIKEKNEILRSEKEYKSKVDQYHLVKNLINNTFNFITSNSSRTNIIKDKLLLISKHIEEYYINKSHNGGSRHQDNSTQPEQPQHQNSVCICNSRSSQSAFKKTQPPQSQEPINIGAIHNQFSNFYSLYRPNTLAPKINTNFSHEFFNFKKNSEYVNYKLSSTRYSGTNDIYQRRYYI